MQTFPVAQYLRRRDPSCEIDWVVEEEYASLVGAHPNVSGVLTIATRKWSFLRLWQDTCKLRKRKYDVIFDLQGNIKSAFVTSFSKSSKKVGFGFSSLPEWPNYFATHQHFNVEKEIPIQRRYLSVAQQFFKDPEIFELQGVELSLDSEEEKKLAVLKGPEKPRMMVAFASKWENKTLSFEMWIEVLKGIGGSFYFVSAGSKDKVIGDKLCSYFPGSVLLENLSFPLWQRLMAEMELVIAVDSAALALCGTTKTPSLSFFGPTKALVYKPIGDRHRYFQGECPYGVSFSARCPKLRTCPTGACLKGLKVEDLSRRC